MATIRVSDYIAQTLVEHGVRHVFLVTGGGAMHLNDAFGRCKGMSYVACHHEQACAIAAGGYARVSGRMAAVSGTTGPGGTNAITGVWGAYVDSVPMVVVSGQVKFETVLRSTVSNFTWPETTTIGTESTYAPHTPVMALVPPGPVVPLTAAIRPLTRAYPPAAIAQACSWWQAT